MPAEDVALVEAGEATGNLDRTLERLADRHEARRAARRRLLTDTSYPLLVFHLAAFLTPLPTGVAKDGRVFGPTWFWTMLAILLPFYAAVGTAIVLQRTAGGRAFLRRVIDLLPGFGHAARRRRLADFAEVLHAAYEAGMPLDRALALAGSATHDPRADAASRDVAGGRTLREALGAAGILPAPLLGAVAVGEKAGELGKVLERIAREESDAAEHIHRRATMVAAKGFYLAVAAWVVYYCVSTMMGYYGQLL